MIIIAIQFNDDIYHIVKIKLFYVISVHTISYPNDQLSTERIWERI